MSPRETEQINTLYELSTATCLPRVGGLIQSLDIDPLAEGKFGSRLTVDGEW